jgi:hypothetical protein
MLTVFTNRNLLLEVVILAGSLPPWRPRANPDDGDGSKQVRRNNWPAKVAVNQSTIEGISNKGVFQCEQ